MFLKMKFDIICYIIRYDNVDVILSKGGSLKML